jgi:hypothetical protein
MIATRLADVPGCAYRSLDEFRIAYSRDAASLAVDQSFSVNWLDLPGANPTVGETLFHFALSWSMAWVGLLLAGLAWSSVGIKALGLIAVSLAAGLYCRPWRGAITWLVAILLLIFSSGFLRWAGGTWLLTAFLVSGWIRWCADRFTDRLLQSEPLLAWALQPRGEDAIHEGPVAFIKTGSSARRTG